MKHFTRISAMVLASAAASAFAVPHLEEEVVVTATRSAYSIDKVPLRIRVITGEEIQRSAARSVAELLRSEGSVQVRDGIGNGRFVSIAARGVAGGQNTLILVDGRKLNNSDLSDPDLTTIVLKDVERIEILEGGAGVLFGDQAVGGVINVITRQGGEPGGTLALGLGSYDAYHGQVGYGGAFGALDYRVSGRVETANGYRDRTDIDYRNLRGEAGYTYGSGRAFVELQDTANDYLLPGALMAFELAADRRQAGNSFNDYAIDSRFHRAGVDHRFGELAELLVSWSERDEDVAIAGQSLSFGASHTRQSREVEALDPRLVFKLGDWRVTLGSDIENYDYQLAVTSAFGLSASEHSHDRRSHYLQTLYSLTETLQLSAGYRHAKLDVDVDGGYFTASYDDSVSVRQLGASYRLSETLRIYLNRDETFRFPLADENVDFLGNVVALKPQEGVAWELGGEWQLAAVDLGLSLFDHAIEDEIGYDVATFANVNFADTRRRGLTLDGGWQMLDNLDLRASVTTMAAEFDSGAVNGNRVPGVAEKLAKLVASWDATADLQLHAEAVYAGSVAVDMLASAGEIGSYKTYNLAATYSLGDLLLKLRLNNILGEEYSELVTYFGVPAYYPSPEENATLSVEFRF